MSAPGENDLMTATTKLVGSLLASAWLLLASNIQADDIIAELLQQNQQQETAITPLLSRAETKETYGLYQDFLRRHPENICLQRAMLKLAIKLGYSQQLRRFYLGELRQWQIRRQQQDESTNTLIGLISLHHFVGCLHRRFYITSREPNQAYLALSHFAQALSLGQDYLPAWLRAGQILEQISGEKNKASIGLCRYHVYRIWHNAAYNPTYFRIYPDEIDFRQPPSRPNAISQADGSRSTVTGVTAFLEEMSGLARWLPAKDISDVRLSLEVAHHYYQKSHEQNPLLASRTIKHALAHAEESLARLQSLHARETQSDVVKMEPVIRRYLARCYYQLKLYALAEEQQFIIANILDKK